MGSSFLTRDQALNLWSGSTDYKTLDYQKTNPREYQIVRTHIKETAEYETWHHPTTSSTLCRTPHPNNKQSKITNPIISRQDYILTQPCPSEEKQTNKNPAQISPYTKLTQTFGQTLRGHKTKGRKNSTFFKEIILSLKKGRIQIPLKPGKRRPQTQQLKKKNEKAEKYCTNECTN